MSGDVLDRTRARRVFLLLTATRWLPVGLIIGIFSLLALERGLTLPQVMTYVAAQGIAVALLELPTSGFADAFGRKPVLVVAGVVNVVSGVAYVMAQSFWAFAVAAFLMGVYRALDSGPLEAWYVDTVHHHEPGADVDRDLAHQGSVLGAAMAATAVLSGTLIALDPVPGWHPFTLPLLLYVVLCGVHLAATVVLLHEPPRAEGPGRAWASVRETPVVIREGVGLVRHNHVLAALVAVELFWATGMVVFEQFQSLRLAELLGSETQAGAWSGPVAAVAWGVFGLGSALAGVLSPRIGVVRTAILARVLNGLGALVMGLMAGPVALVLAYLVTYSLHGLGGAPHMALLHREAHAGNRATVLSLNSLVGFAAFAAASPVLGHLAGATSTQTAMVAAGGFSVLGALLYLPAGRKERASRVSGSTSDQTHGASPSPNEALDV